MTPPQQNIDPYNPEDRTRLFKRLEAGGIALGLVLIAINRSAAGYAVGFFIVLVSLAFLLHTWGNEDLRKRRLSGEADSDELTDGEGSPLETSASMNTAHDTEEESE